MTSTTLIHFGEGKRYYIIVVLKDIMDVSLLLTFLLRNVQWLHLAVCYDITDILCQGSCRQPKDGRRISVLVFTKSSSIKLFCTLLCSCWGNRSPKAWQWRINGNCEPHYWDERFCINCIIYLHVKTKYQHVALLCENKLLACHDMMYCVHSSQS